MDLVQMYIARRTMSDFYAWRWERSRAARRVRADVSRGPLPERSFSRRRRASRLGRA